MKITSLTIVRVWSSADVVFLHTDLPEATYPYKGNLDLKFSVAKGNAEDYCKRNFPDVPVKETTEV